MSHCSLDFRTPKASHLDDLAAVEDSADFFLAKTIQSMEEKMNDTVTHENVVDDVSNAGDNVGSGNVYVTFKKCSPVLFINKDKQKRIFSKYS